MTITLINKINSGKFGTVYKARDGDKQLAVKIVEPRKFRYIELDILTRLQSPFLIKAFKNKIVDTNLGRGIAIELKENNIGQLDSISLPYQQLKRILMSCLYGLKCLHDNNFLHLDISPKNILYTTTETGDIHAYIGDFGFAARCNNVKMGITSTSAVRNKYSPPEIFQKLLDDDKEYYYNNKSDVWSLGMVFMYLLKPDDDTIKSDKDYLERTKNYDEDYIQERINVYNKNKMSPREELELKELLVNMLQFDNKDRLNLDQLDSCAFFKYDSLKDSCQLATPSEIYYTPYIAPQSKRGIKIIQDTFIKNDMGEHAVAIYFLTLTNFIRLMAKSSEDMDDTYFENLILNCINMSFNYYSRGTTTLLEDTDLINKLEGKVGYNPFYYASEYLDDLVILNHLLSENEQLIAFYIFMEPSDLFKLFQNKYEYEFISKQNISFSQFMNINIPTEKDNAVVEIIPLENYHNMDNMTIEDNLMSKHKDIEQKFRDEIYNSIEKHLTEEDVSEEKVDTIYNILTQNIGATNYNQILNDLKDKTITKVFHSLFDYGYITISNSEIIENVDSEKEYVIVRDEQNVSLLHITSEKVIHYYSDKNKQIEDFYTEKNYSYTNNFDYGVGKCCLVKEPCIIFNIYYNQHKEIDFSTKCLEKNTYVMMTVYILLH